MNLFTGITKAENGHILGLRGKNTRDLPECTELARKDILLYHSDQLEVRGRQTFSGV